MEQIVFFLFFWTRCSYSFMYFFGSFVYVLLVVLEVVGISTNHVTYRQLYIQNYKQSTSKTMDIQICEEKASITLSKVYKMYEQGVKKI